MRKILTIARYEYKMQISKFATWGIFVVAMCIALFDNFPSQSNLNRLEFLNDPAYFIYRTMSLEGIFLVFGLMILLSPRLTIDNKNGIKSLIMCLPICKKQYIFGKLLGGFLYSFTILATYVSVSAITYIIATPNIIEILLWFEALIKTIIISVLPVSIFVTFCSLLIPALVGVRLFYLFTVLLLLTNVLFVGTADVMPFYLITSGDIMRLIWTHPNYSQIDVVSIVTNMAFLMGTGVIFLALVFINKKFWRSE